VIAFYVRQPVAPVVIFELLSNRDLATYGGRSLLEAFSNPLRSQETACGKRWSIPTYSKSVPSTQWLCLKFPPPPLG